VRPLVRRLVERDLYGVSGGEGKEAKGDGGEGQPKP
jgi:hypothetical protein